MSISALVLSLALLLPTPAEVLVVQFPARTKVSLPLGGKSKADVQRMATITKVLVRMEELKSPQSVLAGMNSYVTWAISPEGTFDNLGELEVEGPKGSLEATTRFDRFAILITAEPHYMVDRPSARIIARNETARAISSVPLKIEVGAYEYPALPGNPGAVPVLVMEARAAFAIAAAAHAGRKDDLELRQARVALDTLEELFKRASPVDVISAAANAAIRQAQRATFAARR